MRLKFWMILSKWRKIPPQNLYHITNLDIFRSPMSATNEIFEYQNTTWKKITELTGMTDWTRFWVLRIIYNRENQVSLFVFVNKILKIAETQRFGNFFFANSKRIRSNGKLLQSKLCKLSFFCSMKNSCLSDVFGV